MGDFLNVTALRDDLVALSREIHADPELAHEERRAVARIVKFLEARGHSVEVGIGGLATAFRARVGPAGPSVALLAEYDALPGIGHACGHNLIAMSNVGAFVMAAEAGNVLDVGIELIGTPAEEADGGKIRLLEAGVFEKVLAALSSHGGADPTWEVGSTCLGISTQRVTFHGVASHAAFSPERGRNALSAMVSFFVGLDAWREQLPADARVHGIITKGGAAPNVIPDLTEALFNVRAKEPAYLDEMVERFTQVARGAALQTGTTVDVRDTHTAYKPLTPNSVLAALLGEELRRRGVEPIVGKLVLASTDLGDVSQALPTDHVGFPVTETPIPGHSHAMREASATDLAHRNAFLAAEALAAAVRRLATDRALRARLAG